MKDAEIHHEIGESNFTTPPRPSEFLKHSTKLVLQASPTTLPSNSSSISEKMNLNMVSYEKLLLMRTFSASFDHP